ncbi:hypothetical protein T4E_4476 [Trichinella pseudospiralis]|uniref:Uncharacterized protein n=1 Tax=Trichinella pseudospiralis TaxID=6337 RepID=A0A0V0YER4_TRIPS|nr:hypothetical protein T4E_4476 [Trichinella pseudospiralis]
MKNGKKVILSVVAQCSLKEGIDVFCGYHKKIAIRIQIESQFLTAIIVGQFGPTRWVIWLMWI